MARKPRSGSGNKSPKPRNEMARFACDTRESLGQLNRNRDFLRTPLRKPGRSATGKGSLLATEPRHTKGIRIDFSHAEILRSASSWPRTSETLINNVVSHSGSL